MVGIMRLIAARRKPHYSHSSSLFKEIIINGRNKGEIYGKSYIYNSSIESQNNIIKLSQAWFKGRISAASN